VLFLWKAYNIDHERSDILGSGPNWKKIARFKKLQSSSIVFLKDPAFPMRIGKATLSEFPKIYAYSNETQIKPSKKIFRYVLLSVK
jgi:hypothetical protein